MKDGRVGSRLLVAIFLHIENLYGGASYDKPLETYYTVHYAARVDYQEGSSNYRARPTVSSSAGRWLLLLPTRPFPSLGPSGPLSFLFPLLGNYIPI